MSAYKHYNFGLCSMSAFQYDESKSDYKGKFLFTIEDVQTLSFSDEREVITSDVGGCFVRPAAVNSGASTSELSFEINQAPDAFFEAFHGATFEDLTPDATAAADSLENVTGTSVFDATTGVASVAITDEALAANSIVILRAVSATTVDVFTSGREAPIATGLSVVSGSTTTLPGLGVDITGGSGTIGLTTGDEAHFEIRMANTTRRRMDQNDRKDPGALYIVVYGRSTGTNDAEVLHIKRVVPAGFAQEKTAKEFQKYSTTSGVLGTPDGQPWFVERFDLAVE